MIPVEQFVFALKQQVTPRNVSMAAVSMIDIVYSAQKPLDTLLFGKCTFRDFTEIQNFHNHPKLVQLICTIISLQVTMDLSRELKCEGPNNDNPYVMEPSVIGLVHECVDQATRLVIGFCGKKFGPTPCDYTHEQVEALVKKMDLGLALTKSPTL